MAFVADVLREKELNKATIGAELSDIPGSCLDYLRELLPSATFIDCTPIFDEMRSVKSTEELRLLSAANLATAKAITTTFDMARSGDTEKDMARNLVNLTVEYGADGIAFMVLAAGKNVSETHHLPSHYRIKKGDMVPSFEKAAFATAAEDVFKYKIRSMKRQSEVEKLRAVKRAALEGTHFEEIKPENSPTGKSIVARGMKDDMRRLKMETLLKEMADEKGLDSYGLDSGTIGGWADVREKFLGLERKNQATEQDLTAVVDECQTENRQGFGSADFFHTLCKPEYHEIWSENGASTDAAKFNGISDFVAYYTRYSEWIEDLAFLESEDGRDRKSVV
jgi:hypothetical protein